VLRARTEIPTNSVKLSTSWLANIPAEFCVDYFSSLNIVWHYIHLTWSHCPFAYLSVVFPSLSCFITRHSRFILLLILSHFSHITYIETYA
jgi:hypothetical protein